MRTAMRRENALLLSLVTGAVVVVLSVAFAVLR